MDPEEMAAKAQQYLTDFGVVERQAINTRQLFSLHTIVKIMYNKATADRILAFNTDVLSGTPFEHTRL
jgi:hypothetical protein